MIQHDMIMIRAKLPILLSPGEKLKGFSPKVAPIDSALGGNRGVLMRPPFVQRAGDHPFGPETGRPDPLGQRRFSR